MTQPQPTMTKLVVCAHRGASGTHPENTAAAFDEAARLGADMLEFDVRRTLDNQFVIMHDATVDRTTNGHGEVAALTLEQIRSLDAGQGQRVPTLDETLDYARAMMLNINAYPQTDEDVEPMAKALVDAIAQRDLYERSFIAVWSPALLQKVHALDPRVRLCSLYGQGQSDYVAQAQSHVPIQVIQPSHRIATRELVDEAHRDGLKVNVFFADEEDEMRRLIDCGVDGILTNQPAKLLNLRKQLSCPN